MVGTRKSPNLHNGVLEVTNNPTKNGEQELGESTPRRRSRRGSRQGENGGAERRADGGNVLRLPMATRVIKYGVRTGELVRGADLPIKARQEDHSAKRIGRDPVCKGGGKFALPTLSPFS